MPEPSDQFGHGEVMILGTPTVECGPAMLSRDRVEHPRFACPRTVHTLPVAADMRAGAAHARSALFADYARRRICDPRPVTSECSDLAAHRPRPPPGHNRVVPHSVACEPFAGTTVTPSE